MWALTNVLPERVHVRRMRVAASDEAVHDDRALEGVGGVGALPKLVVRRRANDEEQSDEATILLVAERPFLNTP